METVTKTRVTASVNETKALSTSDKTEKGSPRVDTAAAPMKMAKPNKTRVDNLPLTPPDEKRSVSFDMISKVLHIPCENHCTELNGFNGFANSPAEYIAVRDLSNEETQDICVSLFERHTEMRVLFARNQEFFDTVRQFIFEDNEGWNNFLEILYSTRDEKPDSIWMDEISEILSSNPPFLVKFKLIIGYYENDDDSNNNDDNDTNSSTDSSNSIQEEYEDEILTDSCNLSESGYIDITPIRNYPTKLANLESTYPQFFINAKELLCKERKRRGSALGGNHLGSDNPLHPNAEPEESSESLYDEFKRILTTPKSEMNDDEWETRIYEILDDWPQLTRQFEEILIPEIPEVIEIEE